MAYKHGIEVEEQPTAVATPVNGTSGLQVVFGTAPINLLDEPSSAVNKLVLANTFSDAVKALGYSSDYDSYTLCQSMDASFRLFNIAPVIFCNVLDPAKHNEQQAETELNVVNRQATLEVKGMLLGELVVKAGEQTLNKDEHYIASFDDDGYVSISLTDAGAKLALTSKIKVSGKKINPKAVTATDIIGGYDAVTGKETGLELIRQVYPLFSMTPGLIIAPGWSQETAVAAALAAKCEEINGVFKAECLIDISTEKAKVYTDVAKIKKEMGCVSKHAIACYPMIKASDKIFYYSAVAAALIAYTDASNDDVPSLSPSNQALPISATVLKDGTEIMLDQTQANTLNANGVFTAINSNGWRTWGNNTACYPSITDPKDRWIACRRFFTWQGNSFILSYFEKVDNPANYRLIEALVDAENIKGNSLVAQGKCAGMKIEYNADENPVANVLDGKLTFHQKLAPYTPAEYIKNTLEFDPSMLESALTGGNS